MQQADNLNAIPGVDHGFCSINDPLRPAEVFICKQVHSASVIEWQAEQVTNTVEADGVYTGEHQPIAVITADCLPLLIASKNGQKVAAVHGGWKGLQGGIIANAVKRFADEGISVDQLRVAIGPAIIWGPVAVYLLATGAIWQTIVVVLSGVLVIGLADNILRPMLVGRDTGIPDWLVLVTTSSPPALLAAP